jgi:hypothetical protein
MTMRVFGTQLPAGCGGHPGMSRNDTLRGKARETLQRCQRLFLIAAILCGAG